METRLLFCLFHLLLWMEFISAKPGTRVALREGAYEGLVVAISEDVPPTNCDEILDNLEESFREASAFLHSSLEGRAYFRSITVLLPDTWPDCARVAHSSSGETAQQADIKLELTHPVFGDSPWTQQSQGCGEPGDFISLSYKLFQNSDIQDKFGNIGKALVHEWAKYRFGVFDEFGYHDDPIYPQCYHDHRTTHFTGCSNIPMDTSGFCENLTDNDYFRNISNAIHPEASSSIMFAQFMPSVNKFCDEETHNKYAPTKQNVICNRKSIMEVIRQHEDYQNSVSSEDDIDTTPTITYKREMLTRYVLLIEDTRDMLIRESWSFLRIAIRKFVVYDLPDNTEVGIIVANESNAVRLRSLTRLTESTRDAIASSVPYNPGDSRNNILEKAAPCLHCGLTEAINMLEEQATRPAGSVIIMVAPGTDRSSELDAAVNKARDNNIKIVTINYPDVIRQGPLDPLAHASGALAFTVTERRYNRDNSFLSTYFSLTNVFFTIKTEYYQGNKANLPVVVHQRELTDDGRHSVTGSFYLDEALGEPSQFMVFTHNTDNPLIRSLMLVSPSETVYRTRSDLLVPIKILTLQTSLNETGTWTYTIDRFLGNPQPHYVLVTATPKTRTSDIVQARAWTNNPNMSLTNSSKPLILYVEVKKGRWPVVGAKVEVRVTMPGNDSVQAYKERFELLDSGNGDPDITKGDGVYSRYFSGLNGGPGMYTFEIMVTDNGNTAYTWQNPDRRRRLTRSLPEETGVSYCCGSVIKPKSVEPLVPFQRILPAFSVMVESFPAGGNLPPSKIGDLKAEMLPAHLKVRFTWTSPGADGDVGTVDYYDVRYAQDMGTIINDFTNAQRWEYNFPFPLAAGSETTFTIDLTNDPRLLDIPLFFAIRPYDNNVIPGEVSNVVQVLVPSPPPTTTESSTALESSSSVSTEPLLVPGIVSSGADFELEIILPIVIGVVVLAICLGVYFYVFVHRRKKPAKEQPTPPPSTTGPTTTVTPTNYVQSPPRITNGEVNHINHTPSGENGGLSPVHQQSIEYDPQDSKEHLFQYPEKRYSLQDSPISNGGMHIPNGMLTVSMISNGRILSPYQSWTASQLLHEHEKRHSPYGMQPGSYYGPAAYENEMNQNNAPPIPPPPSNNALYGTNNYRNQINNAQHPIYGRHPSQNGHIISHPSMYDGGTPVHSSPQTGSFMSLNSEQNQPARVRMSPGDYEPCVEEENPHKPLVGNGVKVPPPTLPKPVLNNKPGLVPFNPSLQGSLTSVNSDKKKRNITQV